jgi:hypothetical protein
VRLSSSLAWELFGRLCSGMCRCQCRKVEAVWVEHSPLL